MRSKKLILVVLLSLGAAVAAHAQYPRAFGIRGGYGFEASYQHFVSDPHFLEFDLGYDMRGNGGFKLSTLYNFVIARPDWTRAGYWTWYLGLGATLGYLYNDILDDSYGRGFMIAACAGAGVEYCLFNHLGISLDVRPSFGYHVGAKSFYGTKLLGLIPCLGVRYVF